MAYVQTQDGPYPAIAAYDMMAGKTLWGFGTPGVQFGTATMANGTVYLGEVNSNVSECCTVKGGLTAGIHENWVCDVIAVTATQGKFVWSSRSIPESYPPHQPSSETRSTS